MFVMISGVVAYAATACFLKDTLEKINVYDDRRRGCYIINACFRKDILEKLNVCDDSRCGCICRKRIIVGGHP